jgi:hypothetical protein
MPEVPKSGHDIGNIGSDDESIRLPQENKVLPDGFQPPDVLERQRDILAKAAKKKSAIR